MNPSQKPAPPVGAARGFSLGFVLLTKSTVFLGTLLKSAAQLQESWMPLGESIICQAFVTSIVAEIIEKAFAHFGSFRVAVNITSACLKRVPYLRAQNRRSNTAFPKNGPCV